jgi:DNA topoisomerase VI subunit B
MSIETKIDELISALKENTQAILATPAAAQALAPEVKRTRASKTQAAAPVAAVEPEPTASVPAPAAAAAVEPEPTASVPAPAAAAAPATKGVTANDLKKFVKDERTRLKDVSDEAVKKHKEESAKILASFGLADFTAIPEDKAGLILAKFKALNVEQPQLELVDDLDDLDGDDDL